ncbi:MAG: ABC transporter ATP-binding protein [Pseudomonadota bacterium]
MTRLNVSDLSVRRHARSVLRDVSFSMETGEFIGLIGPNGAGKTTLMRAVLGLLDHEGASSVAALPREERAKAVAWMPQAREIAWPVAVETVVMLGRTPHLSSIQQASDADHAAVETALTEMDLLHLRHRAATQLSGGEQARVLIARALAQQTDLVMADEPIAGLDPAHQISTMQTFASLANKGVSSIVSLHDLGLAVRHCTRLLLLGEGGLVADGVPHEVLTPERLARIFGVSAFYQSTDQGPVYQSLEVTR